MEIRSGCILAGGAAWDIAFDEGKPQSPLCNIHWEFLKSKERRKETRRHGPPAPREQTVMSGQSRYQMMQDRNVNGNRKETLGVLQRRAVFNSGEKHPFHHS
jgi:hypothetical protein